MVLTIKAGVSEKKPLEPVDLQRACGVHCFRLGYTAPQALWGITPIRPSRVSPQQNRKAFVTSDRPSHLTTNEADQGEAPTWVGARRTQP